MNKNDLLYLAGFVDGEGCISVDRYSRYKRKESTTINYGIKIAITNSNKSILDWAYTEYGGYIATLKRKKANHYLCYQLVLRHRQAYKLIKDISPYLKIKNELAQVAMKINERCQIGYNHRLGKPTDRQIADEQDYQTMKSLIKQYSFRNTQKEVNGVSFKACKEFK